MQCVIDYSDCVRMTLHALSLLSISKVVKLCEELLFKALQFLLSISLCSGQHFSSSLGGRCRLNGDLGLREVLLVHDDHLRHLLAWLALLLLTRVRLRHFRSVFGRVAESREAWDIGQVWHRWQRRRGLGSLRSRLRSLHRGSSGRRRGHVGRKTNRLNGLRLRWLQLLGWLDWLRGLGNVLVSLGSLGRHARLLDLG